MSAMILEVPGGDWHNEQDHRAPSGPLLLLAPQSDCPVLATPEFNETG